MKRIILGLTGLIGSGKSVVASIFAKCGAEIIDTDIIAHDLTGSHGGAINAITLSFGKEYINRDGAVNREKMRNLVFHDENARLSLETILHPMIYNEVVSRLTTSKATLIVVVVPLLFKVLKYLDLVDYSLFIDCDEKVLFERVKSRSNLSENVINSILLTQLPRDRQLKLADYVIENNGSVLELESSVKILCSKYLSTSFKDK